MGDTSRRTIPSLEEFDIHPVRGFLPVDPLPLRRLQDPYYDPWEHVLDDLISLLLAQRLRVIVKQLPLLSTSKLVTKRDWQRAYLVLSFIGQAYIWGKNEDPEEVNLTYMHDC